MDNRKSPRKKIEISTSSAVDEDKPSRDHSYDALANSISLADPSDPHVMIRKVIWK